MKVLVLKSVEGDGSAHGGFVWPESGKVVCPDWNPEPVCGGGLHGLLWGEGDGTLLNHSKDARWLVLEIESESIINLGGKVKFPECEVIYCGERDVAVEMILERNPVAACCFAKKVIENDGKAIVGDFGTATVGNNGKATAGIYGTATAGDNGIATAEFRGQATAGYYGTAIAGDYGIAIAKDGGQATAGYKGKATAGNYGQVTVGLGGQATVGDYGKATVGDNGKAQCGEGGRIEIEYWDGKRFRVLTGYAGEDIEANVMYEVVDGKFIKSKQWK